MTTATAPQTLTDEQIQSFQRDGFFIARGLFSKDEAQQIRDTFMKQAENGPVEGLSEKVRRKADGVIRGYDANDPLAFYPRMMHPHRHDDKPVGTVAMKYMLEPRLHGILRDLFGDEPLAVQSMFYFKPPGARGQELHQDNFYLRVKPGTCMAAWISVDDADESNGGMKVVPGSQKLEIACPEAADQTKSFTTEAVRPPEGMEAKFVDLKAGDVLFFNGSLIHGSSPNTSKDRFRRSLICHYVPEGTAEMSEWYRDPMRFDRTVKNIAHNKDGGPCGTNAAAISTPH